jgi:hypothetical protein
MCECLRGRAECLFLDGRALGVVLGKAVDGSFLDPVFSAFLEQQQAWFNAKSIASFFWEATISCPAAISIWNETDVTRDIVFRHYDPNSNLIVTDTTRPVFHLLSTKSCFYVVTPNAHQAQG